MPIEIRELLIKAIVAPDPPNKAQEINPALIRKIKKEILDECLREVKNLLKEQKER